MHNTESIAIEMSHPILPANRTLTVCRTLRHRQRLADLCLRQSQRQSLKLESLRKLIDFIEIDAFGYRALSLTARTLICKVDNVRLCLKVDMHVLTWQLIKIPITRVGVVRELHRR